jgi:hypothetical protein
MTRVGWESPEKTGADEVVCIDSCMASLISVFKSSNSGSGLWFCGDNEVVDGEEMPDRSNLFRWRFFAPKT